MVSDFCAVFDKERVAPFARMRWSTFERFIAAASFPRELPLRSAIAGLLPVLGGVPLISKSEGYYVLRFLSTGNRVHLLHLVTVLCQNKLDARECVRAAASSPQSELAFYANCVDTVGKL